MREIKFKAWDRENLQMVKHPFVVSDEGKVFEEYRGGGFVKQFDLMQYTGLKDKNGVEIYEGDILQLHCGPSDGNTAKCGLVAEVVWSEDICGFVRKFPGKMYKVPQGSLKGKTLPDYEIHSWCGSHTCLSKHAEAWGKLEVIGNIYQNPELLQN